MENENLPKMPSLDEVLGKLDKKYVSKESDEDNFSVGNHPVVVRRDDNFVTASYPIEINCMIKEWYNENGDGRIQILQRTIVCPHIRSRKNLNGAPYCSVFMTEFNPLSLLFGDDHIYEDCPYYKDYILRK